MAHPLHNFAELGVDAADVVLVEYPVLVGAGMAGDALDEQGRPVLDGLRRERVAQGVKAPVFKVAVGRFAERLEPRREPVVCPLDERPAVAGGEDVAGDLAQRKGVADRRDRLRPEGAAAFDGGLAAAVIDPSLVQIDHAEPQFREVGVAESAVEPEQDRRPHLHVGLVEQVADLVGGEGRPLTTLLLLGLVAAEVGAGGLAEVAVGGDGRDEVLLVEPGEGLADDGDVLPEAAWTKASGPFLVNAGEVEGGEFVERLCRADAAKEILQRVLVLVEGSWIEFAGLLLHPLGVDVLVEEVFEGNAAARGEGPRRLGRRSAAPQFLEPTFVDAVGLLPRRRLALAGDQLPDAVDALVPAAPRVTGQAVLRTINCHAFILPTCARNASAQQRMRKTPMKSSDFNGLQIRYSPVRIRPRPLSLNTTEYGTCDTVRVVRSVVFAAATHTRKTAEKRGFGRCVLCAAVRGPVRGRIAIRRQRQGGWPVSYRWQTLLAIDFDKWAAETYRANFPGVRVECGPVSDYLDALPDADVILGGPPCQPHSLAGKRLASADDRDGGDDYIAAVAKVRPRMFLMENVDGLVTSEGGRYWQRLYGALEGLGYVIQYRILDAVDFGVPQFRSRLWVWGIRADVYRDGVRHCWPVPTHAWPPLEPCMFGAALLPGVTVGKALEIDGYELRRHRGAGMIERHGERRDIPTDEPAPTINAGVARQFHFIQSHADAPRTVDMPVPSLRSGGAGHDGCCLRLLGRPSPTLVGGSKASHTNGDSVVNDRQWRDDFKKVTRRRLSVPECMTLQSMPAMFAWPEGMGVTHQFRVIGNGWASLMAWHMSRAMAKADPDSRTVIDLFCGGGLGASGWHGKFWSFRHSEMEVTS